MPSLSLESSHSVGMEGPRVVLDGTVTPRPESGGVGPQVQWEEGNLAVAVNGRKASGPGRGEGRTGVKTMRAACATFPQSPASL